MGPTLSLAFDGVLSHSLFLARGQQTLFTTDSKISPFFPGRSLFFDLL
jgi:hypothetical protein